MDFEFFVFFKSEIRGIRRMNDKDTGFLNNKNPFRNKKASPV